MLRIFVIQKKLVSAMSDFEIKKRIFFSVIVFLVAMKNILEKVFNSQSTQERQRNNRWKT